MKKLLLAAVVILALNGNASAQSSSKETSREMAKPVKKGTDLKTGTDKKAQTQPEALTPQKLSFTHAAADTACVPGRKKD